MKRICTFIFMFLLFAMNVYALNLSRVKTWGNEVLTATDLNAEFDNIINHAIVNADVSATAAIVGSKLDLSIPGAIGGTTPGAGTFTTLTSNGNTTIGDAAADTEHHNANTITYEGATADDFETTITITDPTADRTITIPNASGVLLPTGAVFNMISGSCPPGTTDVSATYSNKYVKINATAGTSSALALTGATASHTLTTAEIAAHTHTVTNSSGPSGTDAIAWATGNLQAAVATSSTGGGGGHTHDITTATTLEPSSITMIACQVN